MMTGPTDGLGDPGREELRKEVPPRGGRKVSQKAV